ncbi:MAG: SprT family zinc-dependent metalloprotease [Woeseiaceae bacterium]|nr:SprT family zinc-dependent metalloprotease [Woeseiaceae bacterium]
MPRRTRAADVQQFVAENREWIRRAREELLGAHGVEPFSLPEQILLPAIGGRWHVRYEADDGSRRVRFRQHDGQVVLSGRTGEPQACVAALKRWLAAVAETEFAPQLAALAELTGVGFRRMQVRAQRTCWGSRSASGTISLNLCLLFLRPEVMRYLMIHELCHGRHMNHSRRFWNFVGRFEPDYRQLDRELGESWRDVPVWMGLV